MKLFLILPLLVLAACSTSHKEKSELKDVETNLDRKQDVNGETLGVKGEHLVIQKKRMLAETLRDLQNEVYGMEYDVYGNRSMGSKGLYGVYRDCKIEINSEKWGGNGDMPSIEPKQPVIKETEEFKYGKDESDKLVSVSEEFISERIERFQGYKKILIKRRDEYETKVKVCETQLKNAKAKTNSKQATN